MKRMRKRRRFSKAQIYFYIDYQEIGRRRNRITQISPFSLGEKRTSPWKKTHLTNVEKTQEMYRFRRNKGIHIVQVFYVHECLRRL